MPKKIIKKILPDHKKIKAVALFNPKTLKSNSKMQNDNKKKGIKASIAKIQNLIGLGARNLVVTSAEGTDIDFYEIEDEEDIQVGAKANIDSSPADGSHVMPSGQTYVFASGELTEIQEAESEEEASAEQIQQLQNQLSEKDTEIEELRSKMNAFTTEFTNLKRMIESPEIDEEPRDSNSSGEIGSRRDKVQNRASHL